MPSTMNSMLSYISTHALITMDITIVFHFFKIKIRSDRMTTIMADQEMLK